MTRKEKVEIERLFPCSIRFTTIDIDTMQPDPNIVIDIKKTSIPWGANRILIAEIAKGDIVSLGVQSIGAYVEAEFDRDRSVYSLYLEDNFTNVLITLFDTKLS